MKWHPSDDWPGYTDAIAIAMLLRRLPSRITRLQTIFEADLEFNRYTVPEIARFLNFESLLEVAKTFAYVDLTYDDGAQEIAVGRSMRGSMFLETLPRRVLTFVDELPYTHILEAIAQAAAFDD